MIRLAVPSIGPEDLQAVTDVLASGQLVQGQHVRRFEDMLRAETGAEHVVAVSNGTAALHVALLAAGVRPGDIVLVTAYSWLSTANVIELCGAQPVFVDIERDSFNMNPDELTARLDELMAVRETGARVRAILPVDAFGLMANLPAIQAAATRYDVPVIEDAACALGAKLDSHRAGSLTAAGTFSFHPRKAITTGEGGAVSTSDERFAWRLRALRNHGLDPDSPVPDFVLPGFNYRMTEFQAALGCSQMNKLTRLIDSRRRLAAKYSRLLAGSGVTPPQIGAGHEPVYQSYVCLLPHSLPQPRAAIVASLKEKGVETTIGTWHMPMTRWFRTRYGYRRGDFPVADDVFERSLSIPLYDGMTDAEQKFVVQSLLEAVR